MLEPRPLALNQWATVVNSTRNTSQRERLFLQEGTRVFARKRVLAAAMARTKQEEGAMTARAIASIFKVS